MIVEVPKNVWGNPRFYTSAIRSAAWMNISRPSSVILPKIQQVRMKSSLSDILKGEIAYEQEQTEVDFIHISGYSRVSKSLQ